MINLNEIEGLTKTAVNFEYIWIKFMIELVFYELCRALNLSINLILIICLQTNRGKKILVKW